MPASSVSSSMSPVSAAASHESWASALCWSNHESLCQFSPYCDFTLCLSASE